MGLNPQSSSTSGPALPATPVTLEIEAVRNCVGRVYSFKPRTKRDSKKQHELHGDQLYHYHPVVVIHRQSDGRVHIVIITYSVDTTVDPRMHVPISGNHWNTTEGRPQVNLASKKSYAPEMPKSPSYTGWILGSPSHSKIYRSFIIRVAIYITIMGIFGSTLGPRY